MPLITREHDAESFREAVWEHWGIAECFQPWRVQSWISFWGLNIGF